MMRFIKKQFIKNVVTLLLLVFGINVTAQPDKEEEKLKQEALQLVGTANSELKENNFPVAEADYRKAIALNPVNETAKYNLGNAYYNKSMNEQAMRRYVQAASVATSKAEKHKAYHNLGNAFMNTKKYQEAVEAYKNALRNNPADEETRYNLALAKDMLEKNPPKGGGDDNKDEENKDNKDKENQDKQDKDKEGDEGDEKENEDKGDEKEDPSEGDKKKDEGKPKQPQDKEGEQQPQQAVPGKLSPQQVKNLLEAMNNEEKKVQDKINAQNQKGTKVKSEKDW